MPSYTNSLLILLGISMGYLLIQNAITSTPRSWECWNKDSQHEKKLVYYPLLFDVVIFAESILCLLHSF